MNSNNQEFIFLKLNNVNSHAKIGYKSSTPFQNYIDNSKTRYRFRIEAFTSDDNYIIIAPVDTTLDYQSYYEDLADNFELCLKELPGINIEKVILTVECEYSIEDLIHFMTNYRTEYKLIEIF